jgi:hypothetical protein
MTVSSHVLLDIESDKHAFTERPGHSHVQCVKQAHKPWLTVLEREPVQSREAQ